MRHRTKTENLWEQFGNIPINDDDTIDQAFLHFEKGTDRFEVWHWFEDCLNYSPWRYDNVQDIC
jgi:hypothetical protein